MTESQYGTEYGHVLQFGHADNSGLSKQALFSAFQCGRIPSQTSTLLLLRKH